MHRALSLALLVFAGQLVLPRSQSAADETKVSVRFLDRKEAAAAIVDESMEPYFSVLQPLEMIAKTGAPLAAADVAKDAKDGRPDTQPLERIPAFAAAFGRVPENFHPNETFAVLFSSLAMKDHLAGTGAAADRHAAIDFTKLRGWCRTNFAAVPPTGK